MSASPRTETNSKHSSPRFVKLSIGTVTPNENKIHPRIKIKYYNLWSIRLFSDIFWTLITNNPLKCSIFTSYSNIQYVYILL